MQNQTETSRTFKVFALVAAVLLVLASNAGCSDAETPQAPPAEPVRVVPADASGEETVVDSDALIAQEVARFQSLVGTLMELGGLDAAGATRESLRARIELIPDILNEINRLDRSFPALLRSLPEPFPAADIELVGQIRNTDRVMMSSGLELLTVYEQHFGEWTMTPEGVVEFDGLPEEDINRINGLLALISRAAMEQTRLQQEYMTRQREP